MWSLLSRQKVFENRFSRQEFIQACRRSQLSEIMIKAKWQTLGSIKKLNSWRCVLFLLETHIYKKCYFFLNDIIFLNNITTSMFTSNKSALQHATLLTHFHSIGFHSPWQHVSLTTTTITVGELHTSNIVCCWNSCGTLIAVFVVIVIALYVIGRAHQMPG